MPPVSRFILFEDEHLVVVNKPAGMNTHAPAPHAGEGIYDWMRHRDPRWATLSILHRLDKETSGVLLFGKSTEANRSLTAQFTDHSVRKEYVLLSDRKPPSPFLTAVSHLSRLGEKYVSRPSGAPAPSHPGDPGRAETGFRFLGQEKGGLSRVCASPLTGRTHQIRVHSADYGFPILGDLLYGGTPWPRLCLHAASLTVRHPITDEPLTFRAEPDFEEETGVALRRLLIEEQETTAFRLVHGAGDDHAGWYVDELGDYLLSQSDAELTFAQLRWLERRPGKRAVYHKLLRREPQLRAGAVRRAGPAPTEVSPRLMSGTAADGRFVIRESGVRFELSFDEGYSVGLFLDQRDNRRRLLIQHVARDFRLTHTTTLESPPDLRATPDPTAPPGPKPMHPQGLRGWEALNAFAYTCGFSVCAALAGARTTSLDLSKKYLDWGQQNFRLNDLDPAGHEFIFGDAFEWFRRLGRKGRGFDLILLDPPTFSRSKEQGVFRAEKDYGALVRAALPLLKPGGVLFASTNAARILPEEFLATVQSAVAEEGRRIAQIHYVPQPPDFPITRAEPAHLKTIWLRVE